MDIRAFFKRKKRVSEIMVGYLGESTAKMTGSACPSDPALGRPGARGDTPSWRDSVRGISYSEGPPIKVIVN